MCLFACLALTACADTGDEIRPRALSVRAAPVGAARGADVAIASIDGAPEAVVGKFSALLASAAATRDIPVTEAAKAKYFVRGYLSAYPAENGTTVGYVWDVFDAGKHLAKRVDDVVVIKAKGPDSWALVDEPALNTLAARMADDLAAFLSGTPEAVAARAAPAPAVPLAYAPAN